ncbi:unnamed protein product [Linum tenue]|uniref:Uncharacterized protein n=1 Tax=Linum tenue TaxID=586396 RepID=A0AAV0QZS8_9ROSI|nr:unnamed protein product [Linum tenue]
MRGRTSLNWRRKPRKGRITWGSEGKKSYTSGKQSNEQKRLPAYRTE